MKAQKNFLHGKRKRSRELTKIYLEGGGLPKNHFWLVATQKRENWRTTKLFLKHVSYTLFMGKK